MLRIRIAQEADLAPIQQLIAASFSDDENKAIMNVVAALAQENTTPPIKSFIAESGDQLVGYVAYSPVFTGLDGISGYILAPLAVLPTYQKQGVGTKLIEAGSEVLVAYGVDVLLVYGDPDYYGRFGFTEEIARSFVPPYPLEYPFGWLGMRLSKTEIPNHPIKFECAAALSKPEIW